MNLFRIAMGGCLFMVACGVYAHETFRGPTELIHYDREKAANGYVMFSARPRVDDHEFTYLIDMQGNVVHKWKTVTPAYIGKGFFIYPTAGLTEKGSIIQGLTNVEPRGMRAVGADAEIRTTPPQTAIQELDWNGKLIWEFADRRPGPIYHHSIKRIWNKKLQDWTVMFASQTGASGTDLSSAGPDGVIEVDMRGNVVWQWWSMDHVVQDQDPALPNYGVIKDHPEKFDLNWGGALAGPLIHINALDYSQTRDHVVVSNSRMSEFYVIDHGGTFVPGNVEASTALAAGSGGDILFRWGNPSVYDAGKGPSYDAKGLRRSEGDQQLHSSSDIQWIMEDLPGAGNFLIFNNGTYRATGTRSEVIEINPYAGTYPAAKYRPEMAAGGPARQRVWSFTSAKPNSFYSEDTSSVQRLPNGNTLVMSGGHGHMFQVTRDGEVVWEYVVPVMDVVAKGASLKDIYKKVITDKDHNRTFAALWYPANHPGLAGRDLSPKGKITDILN